MEHDSLLSKLKELEIRCISSDFENFDVSPILDALKSRSDNLALIPVFEFIVTRMTQHKYREVLEAPLYEIGLKYMKEEGLFYYEECCSYSEETIETYVKQLVLLFVGVSALQEFVRANICGPCTEEKGAYSEPLLSSGDKEIVRQYLCKDADFALTNIAQPKLLYMSSKLMSSDCFEEEECCITRKWWLLRCTMVHQRILAEAIGSMYDRMVALLEDVLSLPWTMEDRYTSLLLLFYVECEQMYLYYQRVSEAGKFLTRARELTGLSVELSGAYGKRTHFQQKALPQLFVQLRRKNEARKTPSEGLDESGFPPNLQLQDDTLLNNVSFTDDGGDNDAIRDLSNEEQIVLFGEYSFLKLSGAKDDLQQEEMLSYVNCMLAQRKVWSVYANALVLRCNLERTSSRCMDRALRQLETLIECVKKDNPPLEVRLPFLYAVAFPMLWSLEKMLAVQLMAMGATKTALEVYKRLNLWEDLVLCYQLLGRTSSAVELIEDRLKVEETPLLYCLLGDILDDPKMYEKADSLSGAPSARSQRSLGYYYYKRKDYSACIPYFQKSVEINYLQGGVWFALGYAALQCEMYDLAARAYRQVVVLDDDNFQAWNNLSHAYIKSGQKARAYSSLQEALKCNYEEWRVWENFLLVCVDIGAFEDAIRAYHRITDIKEKYVDVQVLEILVTAINSDVNDFGGSPASRLRSAVQKLFGRVTSKGCKEYKVWELYAMLLCPDPESTTDLETSSKAMRHQQQATVCCSSNDSWPSDVAAFRTVLQTCERYLRLFSSLSQLLVEAKEKAENRTVVKLMTKRILTRAEHGLVNFQDPERSELQDVLSSVTALCNKVVEV